MKKRGLIIFDIVMTIIVVLAMLLTSRATTSKLSVEETKLLADNSDYSFDFVADPEYSRVKAGDTVTIMLSLENLKMGENGLNNVIGYLTYDESVYEVLNIEGVGNWNFERNENKDHEMFGKFVVYTMQEGITEDQDVVKITAKLRENLQPQTTEINFTELKSSDGEVSVDEEDKKVVIEIYEESDEPAPVPDDSTPDEPTPEPEDEKTPDSSKPNKGSEESSKKTPERSASIKTGDAIVLAILILIIATIALNVILIYKNNKAKGSSKGLKFGIISATAIIIAGLVVLGITVFAHNSEITAQINSLDYKESWLNSEKYLVTDDNVSRIAPLTNIDEIEDKFNKDIFVYEKGTDNRVTDGLVKTGMRISDRDDSYEVSVLGDINEDGESNQVELTNIIRATVNSSKWNYSGVKKLSADMNVNGEINEEDKDVSVRYILYGELNIPGFNQVEEPKIEVVGGTFNEIIDAYEDTIQIKITEQDENASKTKYKIEGATTQEYTELTSDERSNGKIISIPENGVYKISAYSYGELGNRSEIPYVIVIKKNPNNNYKVITKTENVDGTYDEVTVEKQGRIGDTVTVGETIPEGFSINQEESSLTGVVTSEDEEELTLIVTYDRNEYTLTIKAGANVNGVAFGNSIDEVQNTVSRRIKFGRTAEIIAKVNEEAGYIITFNRWSSSDTSLVTDTTNRNAEIEMPIGDVTLTAVADKVAARDTMYKVEYYYQQDGIYSNIADDIRAKNGETDTEVTVDDLDKTPTRAGYVLDESKQENFSGIVAGDGSLVLKVYFKQQFTVIYNPGDKGTFEEEKTENIDYGAITPAFVGDLTCEAGYEFSGWNSNIADRVTENVTYTATWKEIEYDITYALDGGTLGEDGEGNPITNPSKYTVNTDTFTISNPTKVGYTFLGWTGTGLSTPNKEVTIEKGSTGNRGYTANWEVIDYTIDYELNGGSLGEDGEGNPVTNPSTYNAETPTFTLNNPSKVGYTFLGWSGTGIPAKDENNEDNYETTVTIERGSTGNRSYEANWRANTGIGYHVQYYLENLDSNDSSNPNNYTLKEDVPLTGTTDTHVIAEIKTYTGFTYDSTNVNGKVDGIVAGDGSLVLKLYYTRNSYELSLAKDENVNTVSGQSKEVNAGIVVNPETGKAIFKYEQPIEIRATLKSQIGYTITFVKWKSSTSSSSEADYLADMFNLTDNFTMPAGDVTLTATSNKVADRVNYAVEFYYQENGEYPTEVSDENKVIRQAETDIEVFVTEEDKTPKQEGYAFDDTKTEYLSGNVNGDGSTVLKVYFKEQFTVTYKAGTHGIFKDGLNTYEEEKTENLDYNSTTPSLRAELLAQTGYEFTGWDKTVESKVTKNVTYTATWRAIEYTISYELNGGTLGENSGTPITNPEKYTVESENITLNNPTKVGYRFLGWTGGVVNEEGEIDDEAETGTTPNITDNTENVTIEKGSIGNRKYTANWEIIEYTIDYNLDGGILPTGVTNPNKYTVETENFTLNNPSKVGYTFLGWTGTDLSRETENVTIAKGSTGNRSYTANWRANTGVTYHVQYYLEKLDSTNPSVVSNYTLQEDKELDGTTGEHVTAEQKTYTGFTFDSTNANNVTDGNIAGDGSLVLKLFYSRNTYELTLAKDENVETVNGESKDVNTGITINPETGKATFKYEQPIEIGASLKTITGYTITFDKWESSDTSLLSDQDSEETKQTTKANFTMPAGNITLTAKTEKQANTVNYKVEYYYEGQNGYEETATTTVTRQAKVDTQVSVTNEDKTATQIGYEFDENAENVLEGIVPATTSETEQLVLKVYFKKSMYTLTIVAGDGINSVTVSNQTSTTQIEKTFKFGDSVSIDATLKTETGYEYTFSKWVSNNQTLLADQTNKQATFTMPAGDVTLTAAANKVAAVVSYKVEFYYQENGVYPTQLADENIETREGLTEGTAQVTNLDKEPKVAGYVYDENNEENIETSTIAADGSTTLKLHFKQVFTVTYKPGEHGSFDETVLRNVDYGANIPDYTGSKTGADGYVFEAWKLTKVGEEEVTEETPVPTVVTNNLEYTAQWTRMSVPTIEHTPTEWTNQNVTVTITKPDNYEAYGVEYTIDDSTEWTEYNAPFEVEQNCIVHARLADGANKGDIIDHEITNIDKIKPEFASKTIVAVSLEEARIDINGTDNLSGIVEYGIVRESYGGQTNFTCDSTLEKPISFSEIYLNGVYTMYLKDAAGNITEETADISCITEYYVAKIVSAPAGYEDLVGTVYTTLKGALEASDEAAQTGNVKIEIIHNIHNEANTIAEGRDYTINLNNYTVKNLSSGNALTVNGKLQVIDEMQNGQGTIVSPYGTGIYISLDGELTLGEDGSEAPSIFSPIIQGKVYGVQKQIDTTAEKILNEDDGKYYYPEGKFNFYDGKIIGGEAAFVGQKVNDTPLLYDPTVKTNAETQNQESTLAIVSGIEAVIGKRRYMLLEDAITAANNTVGGADEQIEITVVKDLQKDDDHKLVVDNTKNIKLDLNGHTITCEANDYLIKNYGKLEICDNGSTDIFNAISGANQFSDDVSVWNDSKNGTYSITLNSGEGRLDESGALVLNGSTTYKIPNWTEGSYAKYEVEVAIDEDFVPVNSSNWYRCSCILGCELGGTQKDTGIIISSDGYYAIGYDTSTIWKSNVRANDGQYHKLKLEYADSYISFYIDDVEQTKINYRSSGSDMPEIGIGWNCSSTDTAIKGKIKSVKINGLTTRGTINAKNYSTILNDCSGKGVVKEFSADDLMTNASTTYGFNVEDGKFVSTNEGRDNSVSNGYIYIDLTDKTDEYVIDVNAEISSELNCDIGYATVTSSAIVPAYNKSEGRFMYISGNQTANSYISTLKGGNEYYIHFGYRKDRNTNTDDDKLTINSITLRNKVSGELMLTSGKIMTEKRGDAYHVVANYATMTVGNNEEPDVRPHLYSSSEYNKLIVNKDSGDLVVNNGYLQATYRGYAIESTGNLEINGGIFSSDYQDVYLKNNTTRAVSNVINDGTFNSGFDDSCNTSTLVVNGGTFNDYNRLDTDDCKVIINNGTFNRPIYIRSKRCNLTINDGIINDLIEIQSDSSNAELVINGGKYHNIIEVNSGTGTVTINDINGTEITTGNTAIDTYGTVNINGGTIKTTSSKQTILVRGGTTTINNGYIYSQGSNAVRVSNSANANLIVKDGILETASQYECIYNEGTSTIILGDSSDDEVSQTKPEILALSGTGVSNTKGGTFKFYDGVIKAKNEKTIIGDLNEIAENVRLIISYEGENNEIEVATLGNPDIPVAQIGETTYTTLQAAVDAVAANNEKTTIKLLQNIVLTDKIEFEDGKNIVLDVDRHSIRSLVSGTVFENNGKFEMMDSNEFDNYIDLASAPDYSNGMIYQDGKLVSTNKTNDSIGSVYFPIDLRDTTEKVKITVNAAVSSEQYDFGYGTILPAGENDEVPAVPSSNSEEGRFFRITREDSGVYSTDIQGGKLYYLFLGYHKDGSRSERNDQFTVNSIEVNNYKTGLSGTSNNLITNNGEMNLKNVKVEMNYEGNYNVQNYSPVVLNKGKLDVNSAQITTTSGRYLDLIKNVDSAELTVNTCDMSTNCSSVVAIYNESSEEVTINGGKIKSTDKDIYNTNGGKIIINGGSFTGCNSRQILYNANGDMTINGGTFDVEIYGKTLVSETGNITINNGKFYATRSEGEGIRIDGATNLIIENVEIYARDRAIYNNNSAGRVTIKDGIYSAYSTCINNIGTADIYDGKFSGYTGIYTYNNSTTTIRNGTFSVSGRGIENYGTTQVLGGTISSTGDYGILNNGTGTVTLGIKGDGTVSKENPSIKGNTGVRNDGTFNFYDGIIEAKNTKTITGGVSDQEEGYEVIVSSKDANYEQAVLDQMPIATVASTVESGKKYKSIQEAIDDCQETDTITIIRNSIIAQNAETAIVPASKNITLDLNGFEILASNENTIVNNGSLEVVDSSEGKTGTIKNTVNTTFKNQGTGTIKFTSGTINNTATYNVVNGGSGTVTVDGASITGYKGVNNEATGSVVVNSGKIETSQNAIMNGSTGNVIINDGTVNTTGRGYIAIENHKGTVTVNNGTVCGGAAISGKDEGNIIIHNGTIYGNYVSSWGADPDYENGQAVLLEKGTLTIDGGTLYCTGDGYVISTLNNSVCNISGGTFERCIYIYSENSELNISGGTFTNSRSHTISNKGNLNITGGTFENTTDSSSIYVIYNEKNAQISNAIISGTRRAIMNDVHGVMHIDSTTITSSLDSAIAVTNYGNISLKETSITAGGTDTEGVFNTGTLTIGENDASIDNDNVVITASKLGIEMRSDTAKLNFYDGTITAQNAVFGEITDIPDNSKINIDNQENVETMTLTSALGNIVRVNGTEYNNIQAAVNSVSDGLQTPTTVEVIADFYATTKDLTTISENKNIVFDLNGHTISNYGSLFINNGTLEITDSEAENRGSITGYSMNLIKNTGKLKVSADFVQTINNCLIDNSSTGNVEVNGGTIVLNDDNRYYDNSVIKTAGGSTVTISGGNISYTCSYRAYANEHYSQCVHVTNENDQYANITISGGTIYGGENVQTRGIYNTKKANITITGGEVKARRVIFGYYSSETNINITGGELICNFTGNDYHDNYGAVGMYYGTINMSGGKITSGNFTGILSDYATINITGGEVSSTDGYGIYSKHRGAVNITGGMVSSSNRYGVYAENGVTLGDNEFPVKTDEPSISGGTYGVYMGGGNLNFYDGIVVGGTKAFNTVVNAIPELYKVRYDNNEKQATLEINATFEQIAMVNGTYYDDLQTAINAAIRANTEVEICKDIVTETSITVSAGSNVTIDLAGYSIVGLHESGALILNNGNLTIIDSVSTDSSAYSKVQSTTGIAIENNGTLTLGVDDGNQNENSPRIVGKTQAVSGSGTLNVFDGKLEVTE